MAAPEFGEMSRQRFAVSYDSAAPVVADHSIDVQSLAPALLAFGKLIREANAEFNGKKSSSKVLVVSDFERKCFNINFEVIFGFFASIKNLLGREEIKSARDVLEWIGLLRGSGKQITLLSYLTWKQGRREVNTTRITDVNGIGVVEVKVTGDNNTIQVPVQIYNLSRNPRALTATRDAFLPLGEEDFDKLKLTDDDGNSEEINAPEVEKIVASCNIGIEESKEVEPEVETTSAWLVVHSPVYDLSEPTWRFKMGKEIITANISETTIAHDALGRGAAMVGDSYQVRLEITTPVDAQGKKKEPSYKILEVLRFVGATPAVQMRLPLRGPPTSNETP